MSNEEILKALKCATDQNPAVLKSAEEWLKTLEKEGNFQVKLSEICREKNIEWTVRWLAAVYLKNCIDKYWRPGQAESLTPDKKVHIRNAILQCLDEPLDQIAIQVAVIIAKIARFDYPKDWYEVIPILISGLSDNEPVMRRRRSALNLKHVVKMLASKRLPNSREVFRSTCNDIFERVFNVWMSGHEMFKHILEDSKDEAMLLFFAENQEIFAKIVSYMIENCAEKNLVEVTNSVFSRIPGDIAISQHCKNSSTLTEHCSKHIVTVLKILESLLFFNAQTYITCAKNTMTVLCGQIHSNSHLNRTATGLSEKFLVRCMNAIKSILDHDQFNNVFLCSPEEKLIVCHYIETLFQHLVAFYLPLTAENLETWDEDPECFSASEADGDSWKFSLRPSTEVLLLALLNKFSENLVPLLMGMLESVQGLDIHNVASIQSDNNTILSSIMSQCTTPFECMVRKEAVYYTIGLSVYHLLEHVNFEEWLLNSLIPEIRSIQTNAHSKLMHRRVLWLISQWAEVKPSDELRPILYAFVVSSLNSGLDMVVRLTASDTVECLLDDFEFDLTLFEQHQDKCIEGLFVLLLECENCESKMRVLHVLSYLISRLGSKILPYEERISSMVPQLWDHAYAENHDMLKCSILTLLTTYITALGPNSARIGYLSIPLIRESINLTQTSHIYLLEDGLELWLCTLQHSVNKSNELLELFENMFALFEYGSEILKTCFCITEAYTVLYQTVFIAKYGNSLDESFTSLSTDVRNECLVLVSNRVQVINEICPDGSYLPCPLYCVDALKKVFTEKDCVLLSANLTLFAQIACQNLQHFLELICKFSARENQDSNLVLMKLLDIWCESIDIMVETNKKKLSALALLSLLSVVHELPPVAKKAPEILCASVQVLYDVCDENHIDLLVNESNETPKELCNASENQHDKRMCILRQQSITSRISLPGFTAAKMNFLKEKLPGSNFQELMSRIGSEIITELNEFISSTR